MIFLICDIFLSSLPRIYYLVIKGNRYLINFELNHMRYYFSEPEKVHINIAHSDHHISSSDLKNVEFQLYNLECDNIYFSKTADDDIYVYMCRAGGQIIITKYLLVLFKIVGKFRRPIYFLYKFYYCFKKKELINYEKKKLQKNPMENNKSKKKI